MEAAGAIILTTVIGVGRVIVSDAVGIVPG